MHQWFRDKSSDAFAQSWSSRVAGLTGELSRKEDQSDNERLLMTHILGWLESSKADANVHKKKK